MYRRGVSDTISASVFNHMKEPHGFIGTTYGPDSDRAQAKSSASSHRTRAGRQRDREPVTALVRAIGVICQDNPHLSLHQPHSLSSSAVADDRVPVTTGSGLVSGCDLKRERFAALECGSAIEPQAGNPHHDKLYRQHFPFLPGRKVSRCAMPFR
jgi:hypothetical protein